MCHTSCHTINMICHKSLILCDIIFIKFDKRIMLQHRKYADLRHFLVGFKSHCRHYLNYSIYADFRKVVSYFVSYFFEDFIKVIIHLSRIGFVHGDNFFLVMLFQDRRIFLVSGHMSSINIRNTIYNSNRSKIRS